jgi:two-component system cell cycle sensor histidine kinase/response regulator CckA
MLYKNTTIDESGVNTFTTDLPDVLQHMVRNVSDGVVIFDSQYRIIDCNNAFKVMLGYDASSSLQLTLADIDTQFSHDSSTGDFSYFTHAFGSIESHYIKKDTSTIDVQVSAMITLLNGQQVALAIVKNSSNREKIEAELLEFKSIVDKTTDCVFIFTRDSLAFTYTNRGAEKQVGYSLDELKSMHPYDIKPDFNEEEFRALIAPLIRNDGGTLNFDTVHRHKNGDLIDVNIILQLVEGQSGEKRFIAIVRDISDYKKLQEQYRHSQKMEAIGRLAGGVAHDFNNQLAVILGYSDLISHHGASSKDGSENGSEYSNEYNKVISGYAKRISDAASVSKKLIDQLLIFSRKSELQLATVDVHDVIRETEEFLSHTMSKKVVISVSLAASSHHVVADKALLKTALLNLALNARDAMPDGGHIFIETERLPFAELKPNTFNEAIQITISDTGSGIPEDQLTKIFEPFYTTKSQGKGTGLGLSSVKGTIEQHGGIINVTSNDDAGATFTITLPTVREQAFTQQSDPVHADVTQAPSSLDGALQPHNEDTIQTSSKATILLVDDEPLVKDVCEELLTLLGYRVITAGSGKVAIDIFTQQQHDIALVIVDYMMPEMLGTEVITALKSIKSDVKVVVSSGYLADTTVAELRQTGVLEVLGKPFSINDLRSVIAKHVG